MNFKVLSVGSAGDSCRVPGFVTTFQKICESCKLFLYWYNSFLIWITQFRGMIYFPNRYTQLRQLFSCFQADSQNGCF